MVGYEKDDINAHKKLIAGCTSGVVTRFITQPLDIIKLRTQLQKTNPRKAYKSQWLPTAMRIFREEGLFGFYAGHNLGQMHSILSVSSQFYVYEIATSYADHFHPSNTHQPYIRFLCGIFAGCCSTTLVLPIEVIRVRQMLVNEQYRGIFNGAVMVYRSGGVLAFYEGLSASLMQMGPAVGISFGTFSYLQPALLRFLHDRDCGADGDCAHSTSNKYKPEHILMASTMAGSAAGFLSKTATYPFDLAKRRLQIASHDHNRKYKIPTTARRLFKCRNLTQCILKTVKKEGVVGLYRGWAITIFKAQLTSVIAFTTYEMMCFLLREMDV
ncbi:mitochondrial thiamine pyrophosphate carrier [Amyelois transitella]|uniref:mitochondrial thiamine pyrophosphate carrier n=1 Tax=Amyelois transitella TaxID=680683 RepID=UPI00067C6D5F|nr:mitochondrial thiamine pyrophosphate carrier [Amyelois transitella]